MKEYSFFKKFNFKMIALVSVLTCSVLLFTYFTFSIFNKDVSENPKTELTEESNKTEEKIKDETKESSKEENSNNITYDTVAKNENIHSQYENLYPELYCKQPTQYLTNHKTIYLTFDDGPSQRTEEILNILKENNVKATFFVIGNNSEQGKSLMKRIVSEGHTIAIHTYSHEYKNIYASVNSYLDDFNKIYNFIYEVTGVKAQIFRFPGGSNTGFNKNIRNDLLSEMTRRGFSYFDWNLCNGDAASSKLVPCDVLVNNVLKNSPYCDVGVVLMHDCNAKKTTVDALPEIISGLKNQGFKFDKLSADVNPTKFRFSKVK